jgi:RimJ/RimL family protein N-acetyltransferase
MSDDTAAEEQFIDFKCPSCGKPISFPASVAGSVQECFNCADPIVLSKSGSEAKPVPLPFSTTRLILRKFNVEDWRDLARLFSDDDFYTAAPFKLNGEEQISRWLDEDATIRLTTPGVPFILAVQSQEHKKVVGCLSLRFRDAEWLQTSLYIVLQRDFQRRGFGTEAIAGALRFCFEGISQHRVQAFCDSDNTGGCRLLEKAGMRREGEFVKDHKAGNKWSNTSLYAILDEEYK